MIVEGEAESIRKRTGRTGEEVTDGRRLARRFLIDRKYRPENAVGKLRMYRDKWIRWDKCWRIMENKAILAEMRGFIEDEVEAAHRKAMVRHDEIKAEPAGEGKAQEAGGPKKKSPDKAMTANALESLLSEVYLSNEIDAPAWIDDDGDERPAPANLVSLDNGLLDVTTGRLHPLTPSLLTFSCSAVAYAEDAPEPTQWLRFLAGCFPDGDSIDALQLFFGYVLSGRTDLHKLLFLVGPPRSGKGVTCKVLRAMMGARNCASSSTQSLAGPFGRNSLLGKPLAIMGDVRITGSTDRVAVFVESLLSIVGEDHVNVDRKNIDALDVQLPTRFVMASNEVPRLTDVSNAIASRMIVVQYTVSHLNREDRGLAERIIAAEMPGVLNWAMEGIQRLRERGELIQPAAGRASLQELADLASPVAAFVRERCVVGDKHDETPVPIVYDAYKSWCAENGRDYVPTKQLFSRDLKAAFSDVGTKPNPVWRGGDRVRVYACIRMQNDDDARADDDDATARSGDQPAATPERSLGVAAASGQLRFASNPVRGIAGLDAEGRR